ncbi:unnamed protein product [Acanthoscelides obtectus]|uniref:Serine/threonine-protein phosphatase 6 regulatory subunit 3 n=1 Tax=Acanthoscelides obtectus TaxID=200917 RepID=A0A9P0L770_ACAOB|nr:unnamed protein product [Acanthoscelides obtectus]CAK1638973.1 Serine/threonine-protein phosphatase 6 regulatory subunit 3 [Acanthoscelides obtectus]
MFWKHNTNASSQIEALLSKENVTLAEVLDSEEIINECRAQNKMLIDFLQKPEVMDELVNLITKEPTLEMDEKLRFKHPNVACELLTCDVPTLNERLASDKALLEKLYTFLKIEPPLNPLLASYFSKVMGVLIAKKTEQNWLSYQFTCLQVLDFLKAKDDFIQLLLRHLGTSAVMDLILKLMTQVEGMEMRQNILNWLDSQRIMQSLVSLLNPKVDKERHYNVAQLLCDFIRTARDTLRNSTERVDPDPLLNTLESTETVSLLLDNILGEEKVDSAIVGGIQVLLSLLDVYQNSLPKLNQTYSTNINEEATDIEQKQKIIQNTTQAICCRIKDFHNLLIEPPKQQPILTTVGLLDPPLGNTRLQVTRLFAALVTTENEEVLKEIESCGTMNVLLELLFKYQWNNFLHLQVKSCFISALNSNNSDEKGDSLNALSKHLLVNCKLIERIIEAWKENDEQQAQEKGLRKGYMGHLISLMNSIVELCSSTCLGQYLKEQLPEVAKSLDEFKETTLSETNKIQDTLLGGVHPDVAVESSDSYGDIPFPQPSATQQQLYSQYQVQNLASYIDGYSGFNDDNFNDGDDTLQTIDHRTDTSFDLSSESELGRQQEMFKRVCAQTVNAFDDGDDNAFDDAAAENTFRTVIEKKDETGEYGSDSDEDLPRDDQEAEDAGMDVDPWSSPKLSAADGSASDPVATNVDPWGTDFGSTRSATSFVPPYSTEVVVTASPEFGGWADFSSARFDDNFSQSDDVFQDAQQKITAMETLRTSTPTPVDAMEKSEETAVKDEKMETQKPSEPAGAGITETADRVIQTGSSEKLAANAVEVKANDSAAAGDMEGAKCDTVVLVPPQFVSQQGSKDVKSTTEVIAAVTATPVVEPSKYVFQTSGNHN